MQQVEASKQEVLNTHDLVSEELFQTEADQRLGITRLKGVSARFGLYHNNYETQERTLRDSGKFYGEICKKKKISRKMIKKYLLKREKVEA